MNAREIKNAKQREKYANDPAYRERQIRRSIDRQRRVKPKYIRSEESKEKQRLNAKRRWVKVRSDFEKWPAIALKRAEKRALNTGVPFDLRVEEIEIPDVCPITLLPFVLGSGRAHARSPSLDKIIPSMGYVSGNVRVISIQANRIKQDCVDPAVFRRVADYLDGKI